MNIISQRIDKSHMEGIDTKETASMMIQERYVEVCKLVLRYSDVWIKQDRY